MGLLHRRHLRLKTLHALYAHFQNDYGENTGQKNLKTGIDKVYELYIMLLQLLAEFKTFAENRAAGNREEKKTLSNTQLPEEIFAANQVLEVLVNAPALEAKVKAFKINWMRNDPDLVDKIFRTFARSEEYKTYINKTEHSWDEDKRMVQKVFKKYVANSEALQRMIEESSVFWIDDLDLVSVNILKTLDAIDESQKELELISLYKDFDDDNQFVKDLFSRTISGWDEHGDLIESLAQNWDVDRIALMDRIIMNMALTELKTFSDIPVKVSLNEYIDLAKEYSTNKSKNFVNGILDKAIKQMREADEINKSGRGLME